MSTEAQKRASRRYNEASTVQLNIRLNRKTDADVIAQLGRQSSKAGYIKKLIREDMGRA